MLDFNQIKRNAFYYKHKTPYHYEQNRKHGKKFVWHIFQSDDLIFQRNKIKSRRKINGRRNVSDEYSRKGRQRSYEKG